MKKKNLKQLIRLARDFAEKINHGGEPAALRTAHEKRKAEREARARGLSRTHAKGIVAERFGNRG